jgi:hypothetical protein
MGAAGKFSCDGCGKSYSWKAELAGRRVKCKCGQAMTVPREDPAAEVESAGFDDLYALAQGTPVEAAPVTPAAYGGGGGGGGTGLCPSCGSATGAGAVICVSCGHNLKTGKKMKTQKVAVEAGAGGGAGGMLAYAGRRPGEEVAARGGDVFINPVTDLYIPMACILVGTMLSYVEVVYGRGIRSPGLAIMYIGISTLMTILLGVPGVLMTVKMFDLGLGPIGPGLLKIIACLVLPGAVGGVILAFVPAGWYLAWFVSFGVTIVMFMKMLEMDYTETVICSMIIWLVRTWGTVALMALLFGAVFGMGGKSGSSKALQMAAGGGLEDVGDDTGMSKHDYDKHIDELVATSKLTEAKSWLAENPEREFRGQVHEKAVAIVNELYAMGAKNVEVVHFAREKDPDESPSEILVTLPKDKAARKKLFGYQKHMLRKAEEDEEDADEDKGQKALVLMFSGETPREVNKRFEAMKKEAKLIEARQWLTEDAGRLIQNVGHEPSRQMVKELYELGAERVETVWEPRQDINEACTNILITLPTDPKARRDIFMLPKKYEEIPKDFVAQKDIGQKYLMLTYWRHRL